MNFKWHNGQHSFYQTAKTINHYLANTAQTEETTRKQGKSKNISSHSSITKLYTQINKTKTLQIQKDCDYVPFNGYSHQISSKKKIFMVGDWRKPSNQEDYRKPNNQIHYRKPDNQEDKEFDEREGPNKVIRVETKHSRTGYSLKQQTFWLNVDHRKQKFPRITKDVNLSIHKKSKRKQSTEILIRKNKLFQESSSCYQQNIQTHPKKTYFSKGYQNRPSKSNHFNHFQGSNCRLLTKISPTSIQSPVFIEQLDTLHKVNDENLEPWNSSAESSKDSFGQLLP